MKEIIIGTSLETESIVRKEDLASYVGSGIVNVYATPMMIALMEQAATTCLAQFLDEGETSVGVMMNTTHDAATPCGMKVSANATITAIDRKKVTFSIQAKDEKDCIGTATHERFIVMKEKFDERANAKL